jgi:hypothetical protein
MMPLMPLMPLMPVQAAAEFVHVSPALDYAQVALAHCDRLLGRRATVFSIVISGIFPTHHPK